MKKNTSAMLDNVNAFMRAYMSVYMKNGNSVFVYKTEKMQSKKSGKKYRLIMLWWQNDCKAQRKIIEFEYANEMFRERDTVVSRKIKNGFNIIFFNKNYS